MKRYDEFCFVKSIQTGAKTYKLYPDEWQPYIDSDLFQVYVKCRKCCGRHEINELCNCCDIETKLPKGFHFKGERI